MNPPKKKATADQRKRLKEMVLDMGLDLARSASAIAMAWGRVKDHVEITDSVGTWAVTSRGKIMINPDWSVGMTGANVQFILAHEMMHVLMRHHDREIAMGLAGIDPSTGKWAPFDATNLQIFRIAQDMAINHALVADGVGTMPTGEHAGVLPPEKYTGEKDAESIYYWLLKNVKIIKVTLTSSGGALQGCGAESEGGGGEDGEDKPGASGEGSASALPSGDDWGQIAREAEAMLRTIGSGSAIATMLRPKPARIDWRKVIRWAHQQMSQEAQNRDVSTYSRPSRREPMIPGAIMRGKVGTDLKRGAVVIDVSGSVPRTLVSKVIGLLLDLQRQFPGSAFYLVTHTDQVVWEGWIRSGGDQAKAQEATAFTGGTDASGAYDAVREAARKRGPFDVLVHFTDCELGTWPELPVAPRKTIVGACGCDVPPANIPAGARAIPVLEG